MSAAADGEEVRERILGVMRATGKPLQSREIARVLGLRVSSVGSHLAYLAKKGTVRSKTIAVGGEVRRGPFIFPESTTRLWYTDRSDVKQTWRDLRHAARLNKKLPRAVLFRTPSPHTDDMKQMLEDIQGNQA